MKFGLRSACRCLTGGILVFILLLVSAGPMAATKDSDDESPLRGFAYVGVFYVTNINTHINAFAQDLPIGARFDLTEQLGLRESLTVPRVSVGWRFKKSHVLAFTWYDLERDGSKVLFEDIDLPDEIIPEGTRVEAFFGTEIYRLTYNWLFHSDEKVSLGFGGGLFVGNLSAGLRLAPPLPGNKVADESFTAPLPVIGGSLSYRVTPKLSVLGHVDWLLVNYDIYKGGLLDLQIFASHRTFKHVGFGAGINAQMLSLDVDDENLFWEIDTDFLGLLFVTSFYF